MDGIYSSEARNYKIFNKLRNLIKLAILFSGRSFLWSNKRNQKVFRVIRKKSQKISDTHNDVNML